MLGIHSFLNQVRECICLKHRSIPAEDASLSPIRRFIDLHSSKQLQKTALLVGRAVGVASAADYSARTRGCMWSSSRAVWETMSSSINWRRTNGRMPPCRK